jgi:hypothetical protein
MNGCKDVGLQNKYIIAQLRSRQREKKTRSDIA